MSLVNGIPADDFELVREAVKALSCYFPEECEEGHELSFDDVDSCYISGMFSTIKELLCVDKRVELAEVLPVI